MYQIKCDGFDLYDPRDDDLIVNSPKCKLETNTVGEASFSIYANHKYYNKMMKMRSIFEILQDGKPIFRGRMTDDTRDFNNIKAVDLEGIMAFFNDSIIKPFKFPDDFLKNADYVASENKVEFFLNWLIEQHNSQVEPFQRFKLGMVTVSDPNNYISRSIEDYTKTWEVLKTRLFDSALGGYLCIRYESDGNYIDYLEDFLVTNSQKIVFGENLLDMTSDSDASGTYSAIIPLGKKKNEIDSTSNDSSRLTIEGLDDGNVTSDIVKKGYTLYSKKAVEAYGFIYAPISESTWDDVAESTNLQEKGVELLTDGIKLANTITIKAVDLHFSDTEIEAFRIYKYINVESKPHNHEGKYKLTKLEIDIQNPQNTVITLGDTQLSMTDINSNIKHESDAKSEKLYAGLENINKTLTELEGTILESCDELFTTKIEQLSKSITLELSGSLGSKASILMKVGNEEYSDELDLSKVRKAFADDNTSIDISAGKITFNSGTIIINSNKFKVASDGTVTATDAIISGEVTTISGKYKAELSSGGLELYYSDILCGTINTKYWSGASTEGISLRVEEGGNYIMFSHADDTQGSGYTVDYYLNAGWSTNYDEMHIFQTSARFLSDVFLDGKTDIGSLRLRGAGGKRYLITANDNGTVTCSLL